MTDTKRLDEVPHMRMRPDTYTGSVRLNKVERSVLNEAGVAFFSSRTPKDDEIDVDDILMVPPSTEMQLVPGFIGIINELLVNAADAHTRSADVNRIKVEIDVESGKISIENNGPAIPCVKIKKYDNVYNPELLFFHLRSGTNFVDTTKRKTGGRNGLGAKVCAIFSRSMVIRIVDTANDIIYTQRARIITNGNIEEDKLVVDEPKITEFKEGKKYTDSVRITLEPDYERFGMQGIDLAHETVLLSRVVDLAATLGKSVTVTLNKRSVSSKLLKTFKQYVEHHAQAPPHEDDSDDNDSDRSEKEDATPKASFMTALINDNWEIGLCLSSSGKFQQTSFVNNINTSGGGTHLDYVWGQMEKELRKIVLSKIYTKNEIKELTAARKSRISDLISNQLHVFINASIENPSFTTQTKEKLSTPVKEFGSVCEIDPKFVARVVKTFNLVDRLNQEKAEDTLKSLKKTQGKAAGIASIEKLTDANEAGKKNRKHTSLMICEGDSAKTFAVAGLSVLGQDNWGALAIRGKPINVRGCKVTRLLKNKEFVHFMCIMGLEHGKEYFSTESLRYDSITELVDADLDGLHIAGLIKNTIEHFFPSLLKIPGFIRQIITPIEIATKTVKGKKEIKNFYSLQQVEDWKKDVGDDEVARWSVKYLKGLGTSTSAEARAYFHDIVNHLIPFYRQDNGCNEALDLAFRGTRVADRKEWLLRFAAAEAQCHVAKNPDHPISYQDFVYKELVLFAWASNHRAIPNAIDGFKPSQRKAMYTVLDTKLTKEMKVAQLAAKIAEYTHYAHGEASMNETVINLAQNYTGSGNNINLLYPSGMFGTRLQNGQDSASPRYIFTYTSPITRYIFRSEDFGLLQHLYEDNQQIEPIQYCPIIPMSLVNAAVGIGFGFSTNSPSYCPQQIIKYLLELISLNEKAVLMAQDQADTAIDTPSVAEAIADKEAVDHTITDKEAMDETITDKESVQAQPEPLLPPSQCGLQRPMLPLEPYYKYFNGTIVANGKKQYTVRGIMEKQESGDNTTITITEIPFTVSIDSYKNCLSKWQTKGLITSFKAFSSEYYPHFEVKLTTEQYKNFEDKLGKGNIYKGLKLQTDLKTSNMVFFVDQNIRVFDNVYDVIDLYYQRRLETYAARIKLLLEQMKDEIKWLENKRRFIGGVNNGEIQVVKQVKEDAIANLRELAFDAKPNTPLEGYAYLLNLHLSSLHTDAVEEIEALCESKRQKIDDLANTTPQNLWRSELEELLVELDRHEQDEALQRTNKSEKFKSAPKQKAKSKRKAKQESSDDSSSDDEVPVRRKAAKPKAKSAKK